MRLTESFIKADVVKCYNWGQETVLKNEYKNEVASEVKVIKLSKEEMETYLKKFK